MKSIYLRNFLVTAITILVGLILIVVSLVGIGKNYIVEQYRVNMENSAVEVGRTAYAFSLTDSINSWGMSMNLSSVAQATGNHIFITDENGIIISCSDDEPKCEHLGVSVPREPLEDIEAFGSYNGESDLSGIYPGARVIVAKPIENSMTGDAIGFVFVSSPERNILNTWSTFLWIVIVVFAGIFAGLLIFSFWYSKNMTQPLDEIASVSRMFARGDFSTRVRQNEDPSNEIGTLIEAFNNMADSLESAEKRRTEFISNVSHELRTPMTTIAGFADGILDGTIPEEEQDKYLISIRDETMRLSRLVRSMLDESRMATMSSDPNRRTDFDLTELLVQILVSFEGRAVKKNLDVDPMLPDEHIVVHADKDGITQVIYNLLDNAVKFAGENTCIDIAIYKDAGKACVSIKDEGETIPPEDLPYIFDRFHKSDRSRSLDKDGVGLGLSLVKTIINAHDEDIAVKSENGFTEFVFTLPLAEKKK